MVKAHKAEMKAVKQAAKTSAKVNKKSGKPENKTWAQVHGAEAVRLFKAGKKIAEIAAHFGDVNRQNRIRRVLAWSGTRPYDSKTAQRSIAKQLKAVAARA